MSGVPPSVVSLTCFVADDHPAIVDSVSLLLESTGVVAVVGSASDGEIALGRIRDLAPDVALIDADLPGLSGLELTRRLTDGGLACGIVLYSEPREPALALQALEAGARGFVLKGGPLVDVTRAVLTVGAGASFVDPELAAAVSRSRAEHASVLTHREREVLALLADGFRNDEVAERLAISSLTVSSHVEHAMQKLRAGSRTEVVATALRQSLIH